MLAYPYHPRAFFRNSFLYLFRALFLSKLSGLISADKTTVGVSFSDVLLFRLNKSFTDLSSFSLKMSEFFEKVGKMGGS